MSPNNDQETVVFADAGYQGGKYPDAVPSID